MGPAGPEGPRGPEGQRGEPGPQGQPGAMGPGASYTFSPGFDIVGSTDVGLFIRTCPEGRAIRRIERDGSVTCDRALDSFILEFFSAVATSSSPVSATSPSVEKFCALTRVDTNVFTHECVVRRNANDTWTVTAKGFSNSPGFDSVICAMTCF